MKPYYQDKWATIYHGDCREIIPELPKVDLVLTDPPYPDYHLEYGNSDLSFLVDIDCRQLVFWSSSVFFPLNFTAWHKWHKQTGIWRKGSSYLPFEFIYERNGGSVNKEYYRHSLLNCKQSADALRDVWWKHPSQKPQILISQLLIESSNHDDIILDPFLGSGTTAYCAKKLNRKCIGIEIEERYCEISAKRCSQSVMNMGV